MASRNFACHDVAKTIVAVGYVLEGAALFIGRLEVEVRYKPENRGSGEPHSDMAGGSVSLHVWCCKRIQRPYYQILGNTCKDEGYWGQCSNFCWSHRICI